MGYWKCKLKRKRTKSGCLMTCKDLRDRACSRITTFKIIQLILAGGGMGLHLCHPSYKTLADHSLVPGVLGAFIVVSAVLLLGHLLNFTAPVRLNVTFSIVAALGYGLCISSIMDSVKHEEDALTWTYFLAKGIVCFAAIAVHLLELLHAFVTRDERPRSLRSGEPSQMVTREPSSHPVQATS